MSFASLSRIVFFALTLISQNLNAEDLASPIWTLKNAQGQTVSSEDFAGQPLVIHFWATWCPYCKKVQHGLERLKQKYTSKGVQFMFISFREDQGAEPQRILDERGITIPTLIDGDSVAMDDFRVRGTPTTFFIQHDGTVLGMTRTSDPDAPLLENAVQQLLSRYQDYGAAE